VQALIAARLDALPPDTKSLLADADVIGKVFWAGAIAHMAQRDLADVIETLRELSRKDLVRRVRRSSIEGEAEYAFMHFLTRDVAYGQLPRPSRASRHIAAARWIESKAPERVEDLADVLAWHYSTALELTQAAGHLDAAVDLEAAALRFLSLAGERALDLDAVSAFSNLERALELAPVGHPEHAEAIARFGEAALDTGRLPQAADALEEAIGSFQAGGDLTAASRAMRSLSEAYFRLGDPRAWGLPDEALELLEPLGPSADLVAALTEMAHSAAIRGRSREGIDFADRAIDLADELGLPCPALALGARGYARADLGDPAGLEDFRQAISLATDAGQGRDGALLLGNMSYKLWLLEGPAAALEVILETSPSRRPAVDGGAESTRAFMLDLLFDMGEIDDVVAGVQAFGLEEGGDTFASLVVRALQARVACLCGGHDIVDLLDSLEQVARGTEDPDSVVGGLGSSALARAELGQERPAAALLSELERYSGARDTENYPVLLAAMVRAAVRIGDRHLAERLMAAPETRTPYAKHASSRRKPRCRRRTGTSRLLQGPMRTPPIDGTGSGSCRSRRSRSSARAGVSSACPDRPRRQRSCNKPARSSSGFRPPPRSPRPTRSCSRPRRAVRRRRERLNCRGIRRLVRISTVNSGFGLGWGCAKAPDGVAVVLRGYSD
jgi:tetratricopeptide (TPR) repeat protein